MSKQVNSPVLFVLSVDTEEEWDWKKEFPQYNAQVDNIQSLKKFQDICNNIGIRPTYFVDYPVVSNTESSQVLRGIVKAGKCEIGAHLHPWCNPPLTKGNGEFESHVVNLPIDLVEKKLARLLDLLRTTFDIDIKSFRTGRWGINSAIMALLIKYGITVDSSVYPFYQNEYFDCNGASVEPYWPDLNSPELIQTQKQQPYLFELPVSAGFNHANFDLCDKIQKFISSHFLSSLRLPGIAWKLKLLKKLYLSPELTSLADMQTLIDVLLKRKSPVIHMNLHSSSLIDLPYNNHAYNHQQIVENMEKAVSYIQQHANVIFCTISEAKQILAQSQVTQ